jgi:hypothetical protein
MVSLSLNAQSVIKTTSSAKNKAADKNTNKRTKVVKFNTMQVIQNDKVVNTVTKEEISTLTYHVQFLSMVLKYEGGIDVFKSESEAKINASGTVFENSFKDLNGNAYFSTLTFTEDNNVSLTVIDKNKPETIIIFSTKTPQTSIQKDIESQNFPILRVMIDKKIANTFNDLDVNLTYDKEFRNLILKSKDVEMNEMFMSPTEASVEKKSGSTTYGNTFTNAKKQMFVLSLTFTPDGNIVFAMVDKKIPNRFLVFSKK